MHDEEQTNTHTTHTPITHHTSHITHMTCKCTPNKQKLTTTTLAEAASSSQTNIKAKAIFIVRDGNEK